MPAVSRLKSLYLSYLSKPAVDRCLYRQIARRPITSIVEMGVGMGLRSARMIELALANAEAGPIRYTGIDLFEARPAFAPGMTLKRAHRVLSSLGAKIRLTPGDPFSALARIANRLTGTDLLVIGADQDANSIEQAWFFIPRMLHEKSVVMVEQTAGFRQLSFDDVTRLASATGSHRKAA